MGKILYVCDRRACETCFIGCFHTNDIRHARDFMLTATGDFIQKDESLECDYDVVLSKKDDNTDHVLKREPEFSDQPGLALGA